MANLYQFPPAEWAGRPGYKICVAITGTSPSAMIERAALVLAEHPFLELRLDSLPEPALLPPLLGLLLEQHPMARLIATCRRREAGGSFRGSVAEELAVLEAAAEAGCSIIDLALESSEAMHWEQHRVFRETLRAADAMLLVSHHDFLATRDLALTMARLMRHQPDLVKLVSTATRLSDNLPILNLLGQQHGCPVVAMAMGEGGILSRVLAPRAGGLFTFGASGAGAETAPGQVAASTLRDLYRVDGPVDGVDQIGSATRVYGVAGKPIAHSLSPLLHNTGFQATGVDAVYLPLATDEASDLVHVARELPLHGLSITMPLKQAVLPLLDYVDALAARVGACNTVVRTGSGELHGYNTDVAGICAPLQRRLGSLKGARVLVLGAGGAARAAVFGLCEQGADVSILNRSAAPAAALASEAGARVAESSLLSGIGPGNAAFDVLVNATPTGMEVSPGEAVENEARIGEGGATRLDSTAWLGAASLNADHPLPARLVFDMVYTPIETPLIQKARGQGLEVITGVEMFVHQGARQFELWTGSAAPEAEMLRAVLRALGGCVD